MASTNPPGRGFQSGIKPTHLYGRTGQRHFLQLNNAMQNCRPTFQHRNKAGVLTLFSVVFGAVTGITYSFGKTYKGYQFKKEVIKEKKDEPIVDLRCPCEMTEEERKLKRKEYEDRSVKEKARQEKWLLKRPKPKEAEPGKIELRRSDEECQLPKFKKDNK